MDSCHRHTKQNRRSPWPHVLLPRRQSCPRAPASCSRAPAGARDLSASLLGLRQGPARGAVAVAPLLRGAVLAQQLQLLAMIFLFLLGGEELRNLSQQQHRPPHLERRQKEA